MPDDMPDELQLEHDELGFLINHVFLPPNLPQSREGKTTTQNRLLIQLLEDTAARYSVDEQDGRSIELINVARKMLVSLREIGVGGIGAVTLRKKIRDMKHGGTYHHLHVILSNG